MIGRPHLSSALWWSHAIESILSTDSRPRLLEKLCHSSAGNFDYLLGAKADASQLRA